MSTPSLGAAQRAVPPRADEIRQQDAEEDRVDEHDVLAVAVRHHDLGQGDVDAVALLAVGVAVLDVVVAHVLVGQGLVGLGDLDVAGVEALHGLVLAGVGLGLVRVQAQRQLAEGALDLFLGGRLGDAQDVVGVPELLDGGVGGLDEIEHGRP